MNSHGGDVSGDAAGRKPDRQQLDHLDEDYSIIDVENGAVESAESPAAATKNVSSPLLHTLGGHHRQHFGGLAVSSLSSLSEYLANSALSTEDVMKLRSIMRFSVEYHNALVISSEHLAPLNPVKQFTMAADECFDVLYKIIVALSADCVDAGQVAAVCDDFRRVESSLAKQQGLAIEQVDGATLEQSICAVHGQMKDFISLIDDSILPKLGRCQKTHGGGCT